MRKLTMKVSRPYDIIIEEGLIAKASSYIKKVYDNKKIFILSDERVANLYLDAFKKGLEDYDVKEIIIEGYEQAKCLDTYEEVCEKLINLGIKRSHLLVALGGGVIGDLCGFVSATLYRGIPFVQVPTSLLAQMDSSIGGKVGINLKEGKNLLGAFHQPKLVLIDPNVINTLDAKELASGMGELIKHAFIGNPHILDILDEGITEEVIYESLLVKKKIVEEDEFDTGKRMILNFGHTFGHVLEKKFGYGYFTHGEAVAMGMLMAINFGEKVGITKNKVYDELLNILIKYNIAHEKYDVKEYLEEIKYDKKNINGVINFILLDTIGKPVIYKINERDIDKIYEN